MLNSLEQATVYILYCMYIIVSQPPSLQVASQKKKPNGPYSFCFNFNSTPQLYISNFNKMGQLTIM